MIIWLSTVQSKIYEKCKKIKKNHVFIFIIISLTVPINVMCFLVCSFFPLYYPQPFVRPRRKTGVAVYYPAALFSDIVASVKSGATECRPGTHSANLTQFLRRRTIGATSSSRIPADEFRIMHVLADYF